MALLLGVDTGGTFTDFVALQNGNLRVHKVLSTPEDPSRAILQGINELGLMPALKADKSLLVHGSTVATNAALENKGVSTAYVTNRGFTDILKIGRQARTKLYDLMPEPAPNPVPEALCLGTGGRVDAEGNVLEPLSDADLSELRSKIKALKPKAIAVNLLFSFLDDSQEKRIEASLSDLAFISRSSFVLPEYREYERGIATWLNAWLGPLVQSYLDNLGKAVAPAAVAVLQSSGETIDADQAGKRAVNMLLSGPAGGLSAATHIGKSVNRRKIITFDMGGTSTDVSLLVETPRLTNTGSIGPYPVAIPMIDIHTIGAGGGSIAYVDQGGSLCVGPASAGATPGPACYAKGGTAATVTDANLVIGRLLPQMVLSGNITLSLERASKAIDILAKQLGLSIEATAQGIVKIAEQHMVRALQVISIERGFNPQEFSMMCFGGAGGLHVCALASQLGVSHLMLPVQGGVLSALGMLVSSPGRQLIKTVNVVLQISQQKEIEATYAALAQTAVTELTAEGHDPALFQVGKSAALRYQGQSFTLTLDWQDIAGLIQGFHLAHKKRFGHEFELPVELVNVMVKVSAPEHELNFPKIARSKCSPTPEISNNGTPVFSRAKLFANDRIVGPALITEQVATSYLAVGWQCQVDQHGHLHLEALT